MICSWQQTIDQQFKASQYTANSTQRIPSQREEQCLKPLLACQDRQFQDRLIQATNTTSEHTSKQEDRGAGHTGMSILRVYFAWGRAIFYLMMSKA